MCLVHDMTVVYYTSALKGSKKKPTGQLLWINCIFANLLHCLQPTQATMDPSRNVLLGKSITAETSLF